MKTITLSDRDKLRSSISAWKIWVVIFTYTLLIGLVVQLILLPYVFPAWHAGNGLLVGGDWVSFNKIAVRLAEKIAAQGWSAWELAPKNQPVAGIAAIFYALIVPMPWTVLPLNAVLHATAALALYQIVRSLTKDEKKSLLAVLPFVLFPSSLTWTAQMHNDSYSIAGQLLFFYGWFLLAHLESYANWKIVLKAALAIVVGVALTWLVRAFLVGILQIISFGIATLLTIAFIIWASQARIQWFKAALAIIIVWILPFTMGFFTTSRKVDRAEKVAIRQNFGWQQPSWQPLVFVERQLRALSVTRQVNIRTWANAGSNIDTQISFHSDLDILRYLPRALQIGFLAPFPRDWFGSGSRAPNTMMRRVSGIEMSLVYLALIGLPIGLWYWRNELGLWIILLYAVSMLLVYSLVTVNVGTLYRFRYPYTMVFVAIGVAAWSTLLKPVLFRLYKRK